MKLKLTKTVLMMSLATISLGLSACSNSNATDTTNETKVTESEAVSKETVLSQVKTATESIQSAQVTTDMTMKLSMNEQENNVNTQSIVQFTTEPFVVKTENLVSDGSQEETITTFMDDSAFYFQLPGSDQWQKQDLSESDVNLTETFRGLPGAEILGQLQNNIENVTVKTEADTYVISFKGSGDDLKELVSSIITAENSASDLANWMDQLEINDFSYQLVVNQNDFQPKSFEINLDYQIVSDEFTMKAVQQQTGHFEKINQIDALELPSVSQ